MKYAVILCGMILAAAGPVYGSGERPEYSHTEYFEHYEGTATCLECHEEEAEDFFHSQHYQWRGESPGIVNADGRRLGKMNTVNDFCTNPLPSWIGDVENEDGKVLAQGCSKCHAGLGAKPEPELSRAQLENIDCLICHASGYRRDLYQDEEGNWEWRPILWKNQYGLDSVSKRISLPKRKMCLRCHSAAGGGPNFKRGDIEYELAECEPEFDVHMAASGNDFSCADCHAGEKHRVRGRGADLSGTDSPDDPLSCSTAECHGDEPHEAGILNRHTARVDCSVCHIPAFARSDPTDMARDWSRPVFKEEAGKYSATIDLQGDVKPVITWFNGRTHHSLMGEPVEPLPDGRVGVMLPQGDRNDDGAKLHAFKVHKGTLPILKDERWLVPIAVDEFFADGDIDRAVKHAAHVVYDLEDIDYEWVETVRYMGIFHEVQPADSALGCLDCHQTGDRLDWQTLGYEEDPLEALLER